MPMTGRTRPSTRGNGAAGPLAASRLAVVSRTAAFSALVVVAIALAACSTSSSASTTSSTAAHPGGATGGAARPFPGASGTIAAINGNSLEVQNPRTGQTTVTYTTATTFDQTVVANSGDVTMGVCISAFGKPATGSSTGGRFGVPVTATSVSIAEPVSGSCSSGSGGFRGDAASGAPPGGPGPGGTSGEQPPGPGQFRGRVPGQFGAASGLVTAVDGSQVTVSETNRSTGASTSVVVTLTAATTFTQRTAASPSDLAVGKCTQATGTADATGAITARSITVSTPGANGCAARLGGPGRFGGSGGPGSSTGSASA